VVVTPTTSVVICTRDRPHLLRRALESVLPQVSPDDEVIVVDDGSDPPVREVSRAVRLIRAPGLGPAGARAAGLDAARGRYIAWCDDDDEWLPGHLDLLTAVLRSDPGTALVYGDAEWHAPGHPPSLPYSLDFEGYVLAEWNYLPISAVAHRADAARSAGGFDPSLASCEDWDLWLRMAAEGWPLRHRAATVTRRHWHPGGHASAPGTPHWEAFSRVYEGHRLRMAAPVPPFDPVTWSDLRQLVCRAVLRPHEGYGVVGANLLLALEARGVEISIAPEGNQAPPGTDVLHRPVPGRDRLGFYYDYRNRPGDLGQERVVLYTMWESSLIPEHLVAAAESCAAVLVPCSQNADAFRIAGVSVPIGVLHHGVDPDEFPLMERPRRETFTFGSFGHLSPRKGTDVLLRAFLDEFGPGDEARLVLKSSVDASAYGLDDPRVQVLSGGVGSSELRDVLAGFDAMVLPSRGEGFGLCGLEAMATGLPLIATAWSGPAEYLDPADSLPLAYRLVDAGGTESNRVRYFGEWAEPELEHLRVQMRWAYEHPVEAAAMGRAASCRIHRDWTWGRAAADLHRYLDTAARASSGGSGPVGSD
jgi:glycosyltransferase involved in cell wall biosynthesis